MMQKQGVANTNCHSPRVSSTCLIFTLLLSAWTVLLAAWLFSLSAFTSPAHDQAWLICAAQRMLAGAQISGPQIAEVNPPLIIWFSAIPALLSRLLHLEPLRVLQLLAFVLAFVSAWCCIWILRIAQPAAPLLLRCSTACAVLSAILFLHGYDIGQREHLLVILTLPWLFFLAFCDSRQVSLPIRCILGFIAGIGFCFKPQQELVLAALIAFIAIRDHSPRRVFSPDFLCALLAVLAYIAAIVIFAPLYLTTTVPLLRDTYWAYGDHTVGALLRGALVYCLMFIATLSILLWRRNSLRYASMAALFLACSFASCIAYCLQHVGAPYQIFPQHAFLMIAIFWTVISFAHKTSVGAWHFNSVFSLSTLIFALLFLPLVIAAGRRTMTDSTAREFPEAVFSQYPSKTSVFIFSDNVWDAFPTVLQHHLVWAGRAPFMWMLPAIVRNQIAGSGSLVPRRVLSPETVQRLAALQRIQTTQDFQRWKPAVVIVTRCDAGHRCRALGPINFNPIPWFLKSSAFAAEWSHYRLQSTHDPFDVYTRIP